MTVALTLRRQIKRLQGHSPSPHLDAEVLLAYVSNRSRTALLTHPERRISPQQQRRFQRLVTGRLAHRPIAYLIGQTEFCGLVLRTTPAALIPRPFTDLLVSACLDYIPKQYSGMIADIGTGSGAVALAIATQRPKATVVGTDISPAALRLARLNGRQLHLNRVQFRRGSLMAPFHRTSSPTIVFANLPYLKPSQLAELSIQHEPRLALAGGPTGLRQVQQLLTEMKDFPMVNLIVLEIDPSQVPQTQRWLRRWSPSVKITNISDGRRVRGLIAQR